MKKLLFSVLGFFSLRADVLSLNIRYEGKDDGSIIHTYLRTTDAAQQAFRGTLTVFGFTYEFRIEKDDNIYTLMLDNRECDGTDIPRELCELRIPMVLGEEYQILLGEELALSWILVEFVDESLLNGHDVVIHMQNPEMSGRPNVDIEAQFGEETTIEYELPQYFCMQNTELFSTVQVALYIEQAK